MRLKTARSLSAFAGAVILMFMIIVAYSLSLVIVLAGVSGIMSAKSLSIISEDAAMDAARFVVYMMLPIVIFFIMVAYASAHKIYDDIYSMCMRRVPNEEKVREKILRNMQKKNKILLPRRGRS